VRSLTVGENSHCVVETPWLAAQCNDFDIMPPPAAELPPQGRWDASPTASLRDRASGWGELQQFVFYFLRAISLFLILSFLCVFSMCFLLLLSYFIPLYYVTHFPTFCILFSCGLLKTLLVNIHSPIFYIIISSFILSSLAICLLFFRYSCLWLTLHLSFPIPLFVLSPSSCPLSSFSICLSVSLLFWASVFFLV
jgi:hypothetical protein